MQAVKVFAGLIQNLVVQDKLAGIQLDSVTFTVGVLADQDFLGPAKLTLRTVCTV